MNLNCYKSHASVVDFNQPLFLRSFNNNYTQSFAYICVSIVHVYIVMH